MRNFVKPFCPISPLHLTLDFFESGIGETILLTFPNGKIGIIDAHPSCGGINRVLQAVSGDELEFVCLTHPHKDHGAGLIEVLKNWEVKCFWHTTPGVQAWAYSVEEFDSYPSYYKNVVDDFMLETGQFMLEIFGTVAQKCIPTRLLHSQIYPIEIGEVSLHILGPEESEQNHFHNAFHEIAKGKRRHVPSYNSISAIFAIEYGGAVALLGGDGLIKGWNSAAIHYRKRKIPKATVLKVPHHGASNAFNLKKGANTYLDLCAKNAKGVLFAGDVDHPDARVEQRLNSKIDLSCLINGRRDLERSKSNTNPLGINIPGARLARVPVSPCQDLITIQISNQGLSLWLTELAAQAVAHAAPQH
jgi:hypothetical protein